MMLFLLSLSWANVESLMTAKTATQIEKIHQQGVHERILKERCDVELKQHWIPVSCFEWLTKTAPSPLVRAQFLVFFNKRCMSALEARPPLPPKKRFSLITSGACFEGVLKYHLDAQYKASVKQTFADFMENLEIGKEIVMQSGHGHGQNHKHQRIQSRRVSGRGLN
jgi:hypothetical protein